jgi:hypothetical protein
LQRSPRDPSSSQDPRRGLSYTGLGDYPLWRALLGGLKNFFDLYRNVVDSWQLYDNSAVTGSRLIAAAEVGEPARILDATAWGNLEEKLR